MKKICISIFLVLLLASCSKSFYALEVAPFNLILTENKAVETVADVLDLYLKSVYGETLPEIQTKIKQVGKNLYRITLIQDKFPDDSVRGSRTILLIEKLGVLWKVKAIKESFKCWKGRGHTSWSIKPCI